MQRIVSVVSVVAVAALLGACQQVKSSSPLSPQVAGPMAGVEISAPKLLEPEQGRKFKPDQQPLVLLIENSAHNSPRAVVYSVEISADASFADPVFSQGQIAPGDGGRTSLTMPGALQVGRIYHWRARAGDGANTSPFSPVQQFEVLEPVIIGAPTPTAPTGNEVTGSRAPTLHVLNAPKSGPYKTPIIYLFEVALDQAFANRVVVEDVNEGSIETTVDVPHNLLGSTTHYWRVRALDGEVTGPWSSVASFRTPAAPAPPPGGGGGGGGGGEPCGPPYPSSGPAVVDCVADQYPEKLVGGISLDERIANMEFLRNRIIETGICGGLDLALNLKRGVGPHSIDAIAWRHDGIDDVIDIGVAFDDAGSPLHLSWQIVGGPPGYDSYFPAPSCK